MSEPKIVLFATTSLRSKIIYNYLDSHFNVIGVIIDGSGKNRELKIKRLKRRMEKFGFFKVFSQQLFNWLIIPILRKTSAKRLKELGVGNNIKNPMEHQNVIVVDDPNNTNVVKFIRSNGADIVFVHGVGIISKKTLKYITQPLLNFHIGITPEYRGIHGGYWSIYNNDGKNFGSTIHLIDAGIDTGKVIVQKRIGFEPSDNYYTYQFVQTVKCLECFDMAVKKIKEGFPVQGGGNMGNPCFKGKYYTHPTFHEYLIKRIIDGVK